MKYFTAALLLLRACHGLNFVAECPQGSTLVLANPMFNPCFEFKATLDANPGCVAANRCEFKNIQRDACEHYVRYSSQHLYRCDTEGPLQAPSGPTSFEDVFDICPLEELTPAELAIKRMNGSPKDQGQYTRPTLSQKQDTRQMMQEIKNENWPMVKLLAERLEALPCRREYEGDRIFMIIAPENMFRQHSGMILMYRLDAPKPIVMDAPHGLRDQDTGEQAAYVFQKSKIMAAILPSMYVSSTGIIDRCQTSRKITDAAHSTENIFFHALVGLADAFPDSVFIEPHRCASCGAIRIGRALVGKASNENSFIRAFLPIASQYIIPNLSSQAKSRGFYATISAAAATESSFKSITGSNFFTRTNVLGKYVQGVLDICKGTKNGVDDTNRYLHVEQQGGFSIKATTSWANALDALAESDFMADRHV